MKNTETKSWTTGEENVQLFHNTGRAGFSFVGAYTFNPWNVISQGTGKQNRIGDSIVARGCLFRLWLANKVDRPNIMYRILIMVYPKTWNNARVTNGSIDPMLTVTNGSNGNYMCLPVDTEKGIKVLYDKIYNVNSGFNANATFPVGSATLTGREAHFFKKIWIKSKKGNVLKYESNGAQDMLNKPMVGMVIPYDSTGTLITDNVASLSYIIRMYFKDP